ncbi:hypothetical protein Ct61P_12926 [Colletotrichum tofieldiae]|nr:hypothetical protein Ct61P_12926 [Colletotrichum tofieldiae]
MDSATPASASCGGPVLPLVPHLRILAGQHPYRIRANKGDRAEGDDAPDDEGSPVSTADAGPRRLCPRQTGHYARYTVCCCKTSLGRGEQVPAVLRFCLEYRPGCSKYLAKRILLRGCLDTTAAGGDGGWPAKKEAADEESKTTVDTYPEGGEEGRSTRSQAAQASLAGSSPNRDRDCDCDCDCDHGCTNPRWQAQPYAPN